MRLMLLVLAVILLLVPVTQGKQDLSQGPGGHVQGIPGTPQPGWGELQRPRRPLDNLCGQGKI